MDYKTAKKAYIKKEAARFNLTVKKFTSMLSVSLCNCGSKNYCTVFRTNRKMNRIIKSTYDKEARKKIQLSYYDSPSETTQRP